MNRRRVSKAQGTRGSELVEFALISFLLVLVVFAALDFCRMVVVSTSIANAARVALRYATLHGADGIANAGNTPSSAANICAVVTNYTAALNTGALTCGGSSGSRIAVSWPDGASVPGSRVQVTVVYVYDPFFSVLPLKVHLGTTTEGYIMY